MLFLRFITNVKRKTKLSERLVVLFSFYYSGIKYYGHILYILGQSTKNKINTRQFYFKY